ncbi:MAG TPA: toll/interleukin-1 receptor domain-containing protein [Thermoanaerobaculia bacterium]|jgi:hypothetical protein
MSYKVFISAAQEDRDIVQDLGRRLRNAGDGVRLLEPEHAVGEDFSKAILKSIEEADEVIPLVTRESLTSRWLFLEMGAALSQHKRVTPVVLGLEPEELPPMVREIRYVKYSDVGAYLPQIAKRALSKAEARSKEARARRVERGAYGGAMQKAPAAGKPKRMAS